MIVLQVIREVIPTQQVIIVGGGVGAWIGLIIAKKYPDLVAGIIGLAADPDFTENLLWRFLPEGKKVSKREQQLSIHRIFPMAHIHTVFMYRMRVWYIFRILMILFLSFLERNNR